MIVFVACLIRENLVSKKIFRNSLHFQCALPVGGLTDRAKTHCNKYHRSKLIKLGILNPAVS